MVSGIDIGESIKEDRCDISKLLRGHFDQVTIVHNIAETDAKGHTQYVKN